MTDWGPWLSEYYGRYRAAIFAPDALDKLVAFHDLAERVREGRGKLIFVGNGASASIASHCAVDFTKQAKVRAIDFNEPNLITAFSNDYGFENFVARAIEFYADEGDALVAVSVSGRSPNLVQAARCAKARNMPVVSFTGSDADNPLRALSDVAFWVGSRAYNIVEGTHMIWATTVVDMLVGKSEYRVS